MLPTVRVGGRDPKDIATGLAEDARAQHGADCGLGLVYNLEESRTVAVFITPEGASDWAVRYPGADERHQLRVSVVSLEHVRRFLLSMC